MPGTLHIFRRNVANGPTLFQLNYTIDSRTYAKVLENESQLNEFLSENLSLAESSIETVWEELRNGTAIIEGVELDYNEANANGMIEAPSDF
jgi:hypothetical protein